MKALLKGKVGRGGIPKPHLDCPFTGRTKGHMGETMSGMAGPMGQVGTGSISTGQSGHMNKSTGLGSPMNEPQGPIGPGADNSRNRPMHGAVRMGANMGCNTGMSSGVPMNSSCPLTTIRRGECGLLFCGMVLIEI